MTRLEQPVPDISADDAAAIAADILGEETPQVEAKPEAGGEEQATDTTEEAQVAAQDESGAEAETAVEGDGKAEPEKVVRPIDAFIASKYGGSEEKFMEGLWNLMNSGSKQHAEIVALKSKLEQALTKPEPEIDPLDTEDGQGLKQQLKAADARVAKANTEQGRILSRVGTIREEIAELKGELKRAEDFEKASIRQAIDQKQALLTRDEDRFNDLESSKEDSLTRKQELLAQVKALKAKHEEQRQSRKDAVAQAAVEQARFSTEINAAVDAMVVSKGFGAESKTRASFFRYLQGEARLHWDANPATPLDPQEFVKLHAEEYFADRVPPKAPSKAKEKIQASGVADTKVAPPGKPTAAGNPAQPPKGKMTLQQSLEWRRRFLG